MKHQNLIRKCKPKSFLYLFSKIALIQNARQPDVTQNTAKDQFMLFVVYCSLCARAVHVMRWPGMHAFEDESTRYGKRKSK